MLKLSFVLPGEIWRKIVKTAEKLDEKLCHKKKKVCFFFSVRKSVGETARSSSVLLYKMENFSENVVL